MYRPGIQFQRVLEAPKAPDALTLKRQADLALDQESLLELLNFQIVLQRAGKPDHVVAGLDIQFGDWQFSSQADSMRFQVPNVY
jgi:hypothetical protein